MGRSARGGQGLTFELKLCGSDDGPKPWDDDADVALTPEGVARQGLAWALDVTGFGPEMGAMLDPGAGSGVYGKVARELLGPSWRLVGVEMAPHPWDWAQHYDTAFERRFQDFPTGLAFDIVAGNPPFSQLNEFVERGLEFLRPGGIMMYLGLNEWGQRAPSHADLWARHRPKFQGRIQQGIRFRRGTNPKTGKPWGADVRSYSNWVWVKGETPRLTMMDTLPRLDASERSWTSPPGQ